MMPAGQSTSTLAYAFKRAFYDAAVKLWEVDHPEMSVGWNSIGTSVPDQYLLVLGTESDQSSGPLGSTNRTRDEVLRLEVQIFVTRYGDVDAAREADEYCFERLSEIERHVRVTDTTLGGAVRECFLVAHATDSQSFEANEQGHLSALGAVFEAKTRVTR